MFILMGQSNMLDFGRVGPEETKGTLTYLTKKEGKDPEFKGNVKTVDALPGQPVRLRFEIKGADLYSYRFQENSR